MGGVGEGEIEQDECQGGEEVGEEDALFVEAFFGGPYGDTEIQGYADAGAEHGVDEGEFVVEGFAGLDEVDAKAGGEEGGEDGEGEAAEGFGGVVEEVVEGGEFHGALGGGFGLEGGYKKVCLVFCCSKGQDFLSSGDELYADGGF